LFYVNFSIDKLFDDIYHTHLLEMYRLIVAYSRDAKRGEYAMPEHIKKLLLKMKQDLLKDLNKDLKSERNDFDTDIGDFYDNADVERGRQLFHLLSGREREKLMLIDDALARIEDGTYGICEDCGKKINRERLKIMPFAKLCVACQSEVEKQSAKMKEIQEEEFTYKDISIGETEDIDDNL